MVLPRTLQTLEQQKFCETTDNNVAVRTCPEGGSFQIQGLSVEGKITIVSIDDSSWTALPATPLTNRNGLGIQNLSGQNIYINYDNTVVGFEGILIPDGAERFYNITDSIVIYAKSGSGAVGVTVEELA